MLQVSSDNFWILNSSFTPGMRSLPPMLICCVYVVEFAFMETISHLQLELWATIIICILGAFCCHCRFSYWCTWSKYICLLVSFLHIFSEASQLGKCSRNQNWWGGYYRIGSHFVRILMFVAELMYSLQPEVWQEQRSETFLTYTRVEDWKAAFILAYSINIGAPPEAE